MSGPRGELVEECQIASSSTQPPSTITSTSTQSPTMPSSTLTSIPPHPTPEEFLFLRPSQLLSLPSFSPYPCPGLEQFPAHLQCDQAGLVEDETGQTVLMVNGNSYGNSDPNDSHKEWWFWRNSAWEKTINSTESRYDSFLKTSMTILAFGKQNP